MHAVIMAGGKGTRLRPYTTCVPKPLVPIGDRYSILEILLLQLRHHGVTSVTLAIGHMGGLIRAFIGDGHRFGLDVSYVSEDQPLGTVGPVLPILADLPERFLMMNGDVLTDLDFSALHRAHTESGAPITVATYHRRISSEFGVLDVQSGHIVGFREKPVIDFEVSMGIYALDRATLQGYAAGQSLGVDVLIGDLLRRGQAPSTFPFGGYWLDIGRPEDYDRANAEFAELQYQLLPHLHVLHGPAASEFRGEAPCAS
ncbi:nucleotidyltransferase family protein [Deinococcus koreensis]|uniref:Nucleoside-diphosphate-sugar pyrophosphorylase n=1 Tax=Deinococcus koreensis TaxID=2054903 RepID=A0A2K3USQ6_9DEIO|nr:sugar phosphate nucleotidyltransferase [Deinococcus koreensis]PNY79574.1 nucleoside-diphosphate-sugar pyrophosphorylase [Deinococcus koreensis]